MVAQSDLQKVIAAALCSSCGRVVVPKGAALCTACKDKPEPREDRA